MVGRIVDWNFGRTSAACCMRTAEKDLETGIPIFWIMEEGTLFRDADGSRYP